VRLARVFSDGGIERATAPALDAGTSANGRGLAFDGQTAWVVWSVGSLTPFGVYRVDLDAGLSAVQVGTLTSPDTTGGVNDMASSGGMSLVSWQGYAARIDSAGHMLDTPPSSLSPAAGFTPWTSVSADPYGWLVFGGDSTILGARVWLDGGSLQAWPLWTPSLGRGAQTVQASFDGRMHLMVWNDVADGTWLQTYGLYVGVDGGAQGAPFRLSTPTHAFEPDVAGLEPGRALAVYARYDPAPGVDSVRVFGLFVEDAGTPDGGSDGGASDASVPDASIADAGAVGPEGGPGSGGNYRVGCGGSATAQAPWVLLLLALLRRLTRSPSGSGPGGRPCTDSRAAR
jgi:hypothetical protein